MCVCVCVCVCVYSIFVCIAGLLLKCLWYTYVYVVGFSHAVCSNECRGHLKVCTCEYELLCVIRNREPDL